MSSFIDYYNVFLNNTLLGKKYRIVFNDNTEIIGIPTCGSFKTPDINTDFSLKVVSDGKSSILKRKFSDILSIELLGDGK